METTAIAALASVIREAVAKAVGPLQAEITILKAQLASLPAPRDGRDGKDADPDFMRLEIAKGVAALPPAAPGKDADPELIRREVVAAVASLPGQRGEKGEAGKDGESIRIADVEPILRGLVATAVAEIPKARDGVDGADGADGKSIDEARVMDMVAARVKEAVSALPVAKDGKDGASVDPAWVVDLVAKSIEALPKPRNGKDGRDVDPDEVDARIAECVKEAVADIPVPKDGINGKDGKSVDAGEVVQLIAKALEVLPKPKDGRDGVDADMERLAVVAREAAIAEAAKIPRPRDGKDGASVTLDQVLPNMIVAVMPELEAEIAKQVSLIPKAQDGKDVDPFYVASLVNTEVQRAVAGIPTPRDGEDGKPGADGKPGRDGISIDDFDLAIEDDGRTLALALRSGNREQVKKTKLACPIDRGVHRPGVKYERGDLVTHGGGLWIAQKDTTAAPESSPDWRLAVKRGRDGKDAS